MDKDAIRSAVLNSLKRVAPDADAIELDDHRTIREQIDIDSIDYLNYVLGLEKTLDVRVPDADYPKLASIEGAIEYLTHRPGSASAEDA